MTQFKIGDVVKIIGQPSPPATVEFVGKNEEVTLLWWDENRKQHQRIHNFNANLLQPVTDMVDADRRIKIGDVVYTKCDIYSGRPSDEYALVVIGYESDLCRCIGRQGDGILHIYTLPEKALIVLESTKEEEA